jgi:YggT family protein
VSTILEILCVILFLYWVVLFIRIIFSWIPPPISGIGRTIFEVVRDLTEPVLGLVRGLLPPIRMGMAALDLSPIIVFIALAVIRSAIGCGGLAL